MKIELTNINKPITELRKGLRIPLPKANRLADQIKLMQQRQKGK